MKIKLTNKQNKGFSLVEMIIYISILSIITSALVVTVVSLLSTFSKLRGYEEIAHTGTVALERITREIRRAESVNTGGSTLGSHPGSLTLSTTDLSDNPTTVIFGLINGRVTIQQGAGTPSPLSTEYVTISNLEFTHIDGVNTEGVLVEMTAEKSIRGATTTKQFRTFVVLDAS